MLSLHLNVNTKHYSPRQKLFWFITLRLGRKYYEGIAGSRKWSSYFALDSRTFNCLQMVSKFIFALFFRINENSKDSLVSPSSNFQERNYVKCISWLLLRASMIFIFTKVAQIEKLPRSINIFIHMKLSDTIVTNIFPTKISVTKWWNLYKYLGTNKQFIKFYENSKVCCCYHF